MLNLAIKVHKSEERAFVNFHRDSNSQIAPLQVGTFSRL